MDPLSLVASVAGASMLSVQLTRTLYEYTAIFSDNSRDMKTLIDEMQSLQVVLGAVNQAFKLNGLAGDGRNETSKEDTHLTMLTAISRCAEEMERLEIMLSKAAMRTESKKYDCMKLVMAKREISEITARLESCRMNLSLLLQVITLNSASRGMSQRSIHYACPTFSLELKLIILAETSQHIYKWLNATDHSSTHHRARSQQLSSTGRWLLDSKEYAEWSASVHSFLYLWGVGKLAASTLTILRVTLRIAGSGKSILLCDNYCQLGRMMY